MTSEWERAVPSFRQSSYESYLGSLMLNASAKKYEREFGGLEYPEAVQS